MAFLTNSLLVDFFLGLTTLTFLFYKVWTRKYKYWKERGVAHLKPTFPFGTLQTDILLKKTHLGAADQQIYNQFKGEKYVGLILGNTPQLMVRDPELIKHIMTRDFSHFVNRSMIAVSKEDFLSNHLFNMEGDSWRRMRNKLSPTFTSGKMKYMFNFIEVVSQQLSDYLTPLAENNSVVEVKDIIARFNTDIIATCAFGLEVNSLNDPNSRFRQIGRLVLTVTKLDALKQNILVFFPIIAKIIPVYFTKPEVYEFILNVLRATMEYRKKNNIVRNDFIDLLTKVREKTLTDDKEEEANEDTHNKESHSEAEEELTIKEMAAQMFVFFLAGFETAASTTTFCLYELSKNKVIQNKARAEIDSVLQTNRGKMTYQGLQELHYMDKCINETLRMYASFPFLARKCNKAFKIPDSDLVIEEGVKIHIPTYSIHHDPEYYPDPYKFDPERFSEEALNSRHHYTFLPFGEGPRICIGKRLGIMQVKMALITVLKDFEVTPAPGLPDQLTIDPPQFVTTSKNPIELVVSKRMRPI